MKIAYTMGTHPDGSEAVVVIVKGTFTIPPLEGAPKLSDAPIDLVMADEFSGEPGFSAPIYESDFALQKHRCDVLLNGTAYAPAGRPSTRVRVGVRIGRWQKTFNVVGHRHWRRRLLRISSSRPERFQRMPISYDNAYGGSDGSHRKEKKHAAFDANPIGKGFHSNLARAAIHGRPLPNTEEVSRPIRKPRGKYRPMAFGPIGRSWKPRSAYAGTYDDAWFESTFPFLPADFDELYYQSAPADQQIDYLRGGEVVHLLNLTPSGEASFVIPSIPMPVTFVRADETEVEQEAVIDTLIIEPDEGRFALVWRASLTLRRNIFELVEAIVGRMPKGWHLARETGKRYLSTL